MSFLAKSKLVSNSNQEQIKYLKPNEQNDSNFVSIQIKNRKKCQKMKHRIKKIKRINFLKSSQSSQCKFLRLYSEYIKLTKNKFSFLCKTDAQSNLKSYPSNKNEINNIWERLFQQIQSSISEGIPLLTLETLNAQRNCSRNNELINQNILINYESENSCESFSDEENIYRGINIETESTDNE